ncbi:MAG: L-rhamnose isomerase [Firmicutes bacterium ADurb.Bin182]|nr:MAG: L-rhamnose isomerase [Firmicutes bacterium ADurb.Bin182]
MDRIEKNYLIAKEAYAALGADTDLALTKLNEIPVSVHCWQIDDLSGFESPDRGLSGGIAAFGNAPGKPASKEEYLNNLTRALKLIPGRNRLALHAIYLENGGKHIERDEIEPHHFAFWVDYAKEMKLGLDFNPTYFSHPKADDGFTLSSSNESIRKFWIEHGKRCRRIGRFFGQKLGSPCITNHWIPDGYKDITIDTLEPRMRLKDSLDQIFSEPISNTENKDSVESKLFGLGSESYVTGSHEFYSNYAALNNNCMVCMDTGHFHPTETVSSKLSSYLAFNREIMLHVSRPVRWDSDHVVLFDDETRAIMQQIVRHNAFDTVHIGTDYFDASIDRIAATVLGARSVKQALLYALLEPYHLLRRYEYEGDFTRRLVLLEQIKTLPFGFVWDEFCRMNDIPGADWINQQKILGGNNNEREQICSHPQH